MSLRMNGDTQFQMIDYMRHILAGDANTVEWDWAVTVAADVVNVHELHTKKFKANTEHILKVSEGGWAMSAELEKRYQVDILAEQAGGYFSVPSEQGLAYTDLEAVPIGEKVV